MQSEQLENLREQLETLRKEEKEYKVKVDASKAELDKLQKTNLALQSDISQVQCTQSCVAYKLVEVQQCCSECQYSVHTVTACKGEN